jgi:ribosome biogenesis protein Nip4
MKAKAVVDFALQFGVRIGLNPDFVVERNGHFFLVNESLQPFLREDFFFAGSFLGKVKGGKFFPSFILLAMLAKAEASRVVVDGKAAWLFICGRDIFRKGIVRVYGSAKKNSNVLVLNEFGECLGFGKIVAREHGEAGKNEVAVRNVSDVGDFLRRERGL